MQSRACVAQWLACAGQDGGSHARPIPASRARSSPLPCQQERGEGEEEEGEGVDDEGSEEMGDDAQSAGSSARQSSAPMSIPRRSSVEGSTRRLRSSGDLWGMHQVCGGRVSFT